MISQREVFSYDLLRFFIELKESYRLIFLFFIILIKNSKQLLRRYWILREGHYRQNNFLKKEESKSFLRFIDIDNKEPY